MQLLPRMTKTDVVMTVLSGLLELGVVVFFVHRKFAR